MVWYGLLYQLWKSLIHLLKMGNHLLLLFYNPRIQSSRSTFISYHDKLKIKQVWNYSICFVGTQDIVFGEVDRWLRDSKRRRNLIENSTFVNNNYENRLLWRWISTWLIMNIQVTLIEIFCFLFKSLFGSVQKLLMKMSHLRLLNLVGNKTNSRSFKWFCD